MDTYVDRYGTDAMLETIEEGYEEGLDHVRGRGSMVSSSVAISDVVHDLIDNLGSSAETSMHR